MITWIHVLCRYYFVLKLLIFVYHVPCPAKTRINADSVAPNQYVHLYILTGELLILLIRLSYHISKIKGRQCLSQIRLGGCKI